MTRLERADSLIEQRLQAFREAVRAPHFSRARARAMVRFFGAQLLLAQDIEAAAHATLARARARRRIY